ncbi:hypothetical protein SBX64_15230 [Vibrio rhizosphaerae]|uniref:Uncharacterized protein n=1 Tax=Vibrio rhizosphaerae TaxID=398736 RepID=A0ABU4IWY0_9VIBR|nr:hypothetical protein [Vibrio rhizosphaerae]MDW6093890.1 hypothetical protein [Vibrio rhizosphaerae]
MKKRVYIASLAFSGLFALPPVTLAQASVKAAPASVQSAVSQTLKTTRARLRQQMGINPEIQEAPVDTVTLPIYPGALMVVHKHHGINFDDLDQTLPFATFITEADVEQVIRFYREKLPSYSALQNDTATVLVQERVERGHYPQDYLKIPSVSIDSVTLSNDKTGTLIAVMYPWLAE